MTPMCTGRWRRSIANAVRHRMRCESRRPRLLPQIRGGRNEDRNPGTEYRDHIEYLRTCMRQLRKISEDEPAHPQYPLTVPYKGHRFRDTGPALVALEPCRADYC